MARKLEAVLDLDSRGFTIGLKSAGAQIASFSGTLNSLNVNIGNTSRQMASMERSLRGPLQTVRDWTVILGEAREAFGFLREMTVGWVGEMVMAGAETQRFTQMLKGMSAGITEAERLNDVKKSMGELRTLAQTTPFDLKSLGDSFLKLKSAGIDPLDGSLKALVDGVAAFGGTSDTLHRASIAIQQMAGKGVISMEELRQQLGEAVPTAMKAMAAGMNMSVQELTQKVSNGQVMATNALKKMSAQFEASFGGSALRMMNTFSGQLEILKTNWQLFQAAVVGMDVSNGAATPGGLLDTLTDKLKEINAWLSSTNGQQFAQSVGSSILQVVNALQSLIEWVVKYREELKTVGEMAALVFGSRLMIVGIASTIAKIGSAITAFNAWRAAAAAVATAQATAATATVAAGTAAAGTTVAVTGLGAAMTALGELISVAAGPAGWIALLVVGLGVAANRMGLLASKTQAAADAQQRLKEGRSSIDDVKFLDARINQIQNDSTFQWVRNADGSAKPKDKYWSVAQGAELKRTQGMADELQSLIADKAKIIGNAQVSVYEKAWNSLDKRTDASLEGFQKRANATVSAAQDKLNSLKNPTQADKNAFGKTRSDAQNQMYRQEIGTLEDKNKAYEILIAKYQKEGKTNLISGLQTRIKTTNTQIAELKSNLTNLTMADSLDQGLTGGKKKGKDPVGNEMLTEYKSLSAQIAKIEAQLKGLGDDEAEANAKIAAAGVKRSQVTKAEVDALARKKDYLDVVLKAHNKAEEQIKSIDTAFETLEMNAKQTGDAFQDAMSWLTTGATAAQKSLDRLNQKWDNSLEPLKKAKKAAEDYVAVLQRAPVPNADAIAQAQRAVQEATDKLSQAQIEAIDAAKKENAAKSLEELHSISDEADAWSAALRGQDAEREFNHQKEMQRFEATKAAIMAVSGVSAEVTARLAQTEQELLRKQRFENLGAIGTQLQGMSDWMGNIKDLGAHALDGFVDALAGGSRSMKQFAKDMIKQLAMIILKALLAKIILSALGLGGGGSLGSSSNFASNGNFASSFGGGQGINTNTSFNFGAHHKGGIAGFPSMYRNVDPSVFIGASKFHTGRMPKLMSGEVPAILKEDEGVFTKEQMAALGRGGQVQPPKTTINFINNSGHVLDAEQQDARFDGRDYVIDLVVDALNKPGRMRDSVKGIR